LRCVVAVTVNTQQNKRGNDQQNQHTHQDPGFVADGVKHGQSLGLTIKKANLGFAFV
jgi:hypothetical protein